MTGGSRLLQICGHLRCRLTKNSPRRTTSTPAGVFCTLLASAPPICQSAGRGAGIYCVVRQKSVLNVSKIRLRPPRMAVVMSTRVLLKQNFKIKNVYGCTFCTIMYDMDGFDKSLPCISRGGTQLAVIFC